MQGYGQYCPIAKAAEILGQRWTLLILRDLLYGARRFNEVRRGVPRMSQSLLSQRLKDFERFGLVVRVRDRESGAIEYHPTPAARELLPVLELLGAWGQRWVRHRFTKDELDVNFLMWYVRLGIDADKFPPERTVIEFDYTDRPRLRRDPWWADKWWLIIEKGEVDLCVTDPGYEVDLFVVTDLRTMTRVYMGDIPIREALHSEAVQLHGSTRLTKSFDQWMPVSPLGRIEMPPEPLDIRRIVTALHADAAPAPRENLGI